MKKILNLFLIILLIAVQANAFSLCAEVRVAFEYENHSPVCLNITDSITHFIENTEVLNSPHYPEISKSLSIMHRNSAVSLWVNGLGTTTAFEELMMQLRSAKEHGMDPERYNTPELEESVGKLFKEGADKSDFRKVNVQISANYLLFIYEMKRGRIKPEKLSGYWNRDVKTKTLLTDIEKVRSAENLRTFYDNLTTKSERYVKLQKQLVHYEALAESGGWQTIEDELEEALKVGMRHAMIPAIKRRLAVTNPTYQLLLAGDSLETSPDSVQRMFDHKMHMALERFQKRHGLKVDGVVGKSTLSVLNQSIEDKVLQIKLNLERLRWLPNEFTPNYLFVNIPEYKLRVYEEGEKALEMRVIVGKEYSSTPVFSDTLKYLEMSPKWTVPLSIKGKEMLPRLLTDGSYYTKRNYKFYRGWSQTDEVNPAKIDWTQYSADHFPFNVVQQPGPSNALGLVKFIMPNNMSIYLHDTPTDHLFKKPERAMSHGCIRLDEPKVLAEYLLQDQPKWTSDKIWEYMNKDEPERVYLKKDYHVQIAYLTAFVDDDGVMNFRNDIYGHDQRQIERLAALTNSFTTE